MTEERERVRTLISRKFTGRFSCAALAPAFADTVAECIGVSSNTPEEADALVDQYAAGMKRVIRENWEIICEARLAETDGTA